VQSVVEALRAKGWQLDIAYPEKPRDPTVITLTGQPKRYIDISEGVVSLNIDQEGIGGDTTICDLVLSEDARERADQLAEISMWFGR